MIAQDAYVPLTGCINSAILNGIFLGKKVILTTKSIDRFFEKCKVYIKILF